MGNPNKSLVTTKKQCSKMAVTKGNVPLKEPPKWQLQQTKRRKRPSTEEGRDGAITEKHPHITKDNVAQTHGKGHEPQKTTQPFPNPRVERTTTTDNETKAQKLKQT